MSITVILTFTPKNVSSNNLFDTVELHREIETWANNVALQYIGARFEVKVLECFTGDNAVDDSPIAWNDRTIRKGNGKH